MRRCAPATAALAGLILAAAGASAQAVPLSARRDTLPPAARTTLLPLQAPLLGNVQWTGFTDEQQQQGLPRRQTRRFAMWGAIGGAAAGALAGGWMALYCSGTPDSCWQAFPLMTGLGAAAGAVGGAIIGAAVPGPGARGPAEPIGSGQVTAGFAHGSVAGFVPTGRDGLPGGDQTYTGSGMTARANVYAELKPWLALGPELGIAQLGSDAGDVRHIAVAARLSGRRGAVAPYATVNLGAYDSSRPSLEYLGGGIGAGARLQPGGGDQFFLDVEARYSRNAQNIAPMRMRSLAVSGGLYW